MTAPAKQGKFLPWYRAEKQRLTSIEHMAKRLIGIFVVALMGCVAGYFLGVTIACDWLYPTSNLCGIYGIFITGPIGLVIGAVCGWAMTRPQETQ